MEIKTKLFFILFFKIFMDMFSYDFVVFMITQMKRKSSDQFEKREESLARARAAIKKAARTRTYTSYKEESYVPRGSVYINPYAFHQLRFVSCNFLSLDFLHLLFKF